MLVLICGLFLTANQLTALPFSVGELEGRIDTTLAFGASYRLGDPSPDLIGIANGGTAFSVNYDDGNLNYKKGINSLSGRFITEMQLDYKNFGGFVRFTGFYDIENMDNDRARTPLSKQAEDRVGRRLEILDYYAYASFASDITVVDLRLGSQVLNWGESTFIQNGINAINPIDVSKIRSPGAELREALQPVPMVYANVGLGDLFSIEGFYQIRWEETVIDPAGTYFSSNDFVSEGGEALYLGFGAVSDFTPPGFGARVPRGENRYASNGGQYGAALRFLIPQLGYTELALYYINYHSRLPYISGQAGTLAGIIGGDYAGSANYFAIYPEDIQLFGLSFNTDVGNTGIALQGEISYRDKMPFQVDDVELLFTALSAPSALLPADPTNPNLQGAFFLGQNSQLGFASFSEEISGNRERAMWQGSMTATKAFGPTFGADQWVLVGEVGFTHADLPGKEVLRFDGPATYTSGNPIFTTAGVQPATTDINSFADSFSWGYRLVTRWDFNNAFFGVNMSPLFAFNHDVSGNTPLPVGNFLEGRMSSTIGINFDYQASYVLELRLANYWGATGRNFVGDRDFVSATFKYSF